MSGSWANAVETLIKQAKATHTDFNDMSNVSGWKMSMLGAEQQLEGGGNASENPARIP
jgi:hypothetical protein